MNLDAAVEELLECWSLSNDNMTCIANNNAENMIRMADVGAMRRLPCFGHILHNAVKHSMGSSEIVETTRKLKRVVAFLHQRHDKRRS